MTRTNQALQDAVLLAASRFGGMRCTDVPGYTTQESYRVAQRLVGNGVLHTASALGGRYVRYFTDPAARDAWYLAQQSVNTFTRPAPKRCLAKHVTGMETAPHRVVPIPAGARHASTTSPLHAADAAAAAAARMPGELVPFVYRPGSQDHERHPSRTGDRLTYRDGRTARVGGSAEG